MTKESGRNGSRYAARQIKGELIPVHDGGQFHNGFKPPPIRVFFYHHKPYYRPVPSVVTPGSLQLLRYLSPSLTVIVQKRSRDALVFTLNPYEHTGLRDAASPLSFYPAPI